MQFQEEQRIGNVGFQIFYGLSSLPPFFIMGNELKKASSEDAYNEALFALIGIVILFIGLYFLLFRTAAKTRIDSVGIHYRYWPIIFNWKTIQWSEMISIEVKKYNALNDFGGWGYKFGRKKSGIVLGGDKAIFIEKVKGKTFAISTFKAEAADAAITYWAPEKKLTHG